MRVVFSALLLLALFSSSCASKKPAAGSFMPLGSHNVVVNPANALEGKVVTVNQFAQFVVLNFPIGQLPALEQRLSVYRQGLRVGEVKVTGPRQDDNIAADIIAGDVQVGDEVRER